MLGAEIMKELLLDATERSRHERTSPLENQRTMPKAEYLHKGGNVLDEVWPTKIA